MGLKISVVFLVVASFILQPVVAQCQAQTADAQGLDSIACDSLSEYLRFGRDNNLVEMKKLQSFLRTQGFDVAVSGFFDVTTFEAVKQFQEEYASDILAPWGVSVPTGYVFITTKHKINDLLCGVNTPLTEGELGQIARTNQVLVGITGEISGTTQAPDILNLENTVGLNENEQTENETTGLSGALIASFGGNMLYWLGGLFIVLACLGFWLILKQFFMKKKKASLNAPVA